MKRKIRLSLLMFFWMICSFMVVMGTVCPIVSNAEGDLTEKVRLLDLKVVKADGSEVSKENKIRMNDTVQLIYSWKIEQEKSAEIKAGDNFTLSLPDNHYFRIDESSPPLQLKNTLTNETFGQAKRNGNQLLVTINEQDAKQKETLNLQLAIKAKAIQAGSGISMGSTNIPKVEIVESETLIQAEAKVAGVGSLTSPRNFEYVILDKENLTKPIAYGITERKIVQKGEAVNIAFYKNKTAQGNLLEEIAGNTGALGWYSLLKDEHSYLIREVPDPEYLAVITGGVGEGYQYDYQADTQQHTHFKILNQTALKEQLPNNLAKVPAIAIPQSKDEQPLQPEEELKIKDTARKRIAAPASTDEPGKIENDKKGILLTKTDSASGEKLQGAEFELKNAKGEKMYLRKKLITDENGELHINSLPDGKYSLLEIAAPEGYERDSQPIEFTFDEADKLVTLTKENTKTEKAAPIKKVFPKESESSKAASSEQASKTVPSSTEKKYPNTGMKTNDSFYILGCLLLVSLGFYQKKR